MPSDYQRITQDSIRRHSEEFDDIGELLSRELYSGRTHFIYEPLQNVEDALLRRAKSAPQCDLPRTVAFRCGSLTSQSIVTSVCGGCSASRRRRNVVSPPWKPCCRIGWMCCPAYHPVGSRFTDRNATDVLQDHPRRLLVQARR
jgi:hypothetical protein